MFWDFCFGCFGEFDLSCKGLLSLHDWNVQILEMLVILSNNCGLVFEDEIFETVNFENITYSG